MNSQNTRSLAIEARGNGFRQQRKPGIRLLGKWLQAAGFYPGQRCTVRFVANGVIELTAEKENTGPVFRIPIPHKE